MRSHRGGNGEGPPPDDGGLPDLPPEWGVVVIPDDLTELDRETAVLRRERRQSARRSRWRRRFGLTAAGNNSGPLLIMAIAVVTALTSLFAIMLSTHVPRGTTPATKAITSTTRQAMIDLSLSDGLGREVRLRDRLPAVILLLDGCTCADLIDETLAAAPAKVTVLVIDRVAPELATASTATASTATALADPEQALLATYGDGPDRRATPAGQPVVVLVGADGTVTATVNPALTIADYEQPLIALGQ